MMSKNNKPTEELDSELLSESELVSEEHFDKSSDDEFQSSFDEARPSNNYEEEIQDISPKKNNFKKIIIFGVIGVIVSCMLAYLFLGNSDDDDDVIPIQPTQTIPQPDIPPQSEVSEVPEIPDSSIEKSEIKKSPELINNGEVLKDFNYVPNTGINNQNLDQGMGELNISSYDQHNSQEQISTPNVIESIPNNTNSTIEPVVKPVDTVITPIATTQTSVLTNEVQNELLSIVKENNKLLLNINEKLESLNSLDKLDKLDILNKLDNNDQEIKQLINDTMTEVKNKECTTNSKTQVSKTKAVSPNFIKTEDAVKKQPVKKKVVKKVTNPQYSLKSIMVGRVWIELPNGTIESFGIGDYLPNGNRIGNIDPDTGVFDTTGKLIIK